VQLRTEGVPADVGQSIELAAYRVVQEALTNAVAHAGPCTVTVTLSYRSDALEVDVADNGTAPGGTAGGGYGLAGLRERVALLGGTLEAGPRAGGGFRVHALIPMGQA
jgi:signal transduction histidine kinase